MEEDTKMVSQENKDDAALGTDASVVAISFDLLLTSVMI